MKAFLISLGIFASSFLLTIYRGFVLSKLWLWFMVSIFGLSALSVVQAIGLSIVGNAFLPSPMPKTDPDKSVVEAYISALFYSFGMVSFYWGVGAIVKMFL